MERPQDSLDSEILALEIQLQTTDYVTGDMKGKSTMHQQQDFDVAVSDLRDQLLQRLNLLRDLAMAKSIARSVQTDSAVLSTLAQEEAQANTDRVLALSRSGQATPRSHLPSYQEALDEDLLKTITSLSLQGEPSYSSDEEASGAGPSSAFSKSQVQILEVVTKRKACTACRDDYLEVDVAIAPCRKHLYCFACLRSLFVRATKDEGLYPPRCCRLPIPLDIVKRHLSSAELDAFEEASIEFSSANRTYCSNVVCSRFITQDHIKGDQAHCTHCGQVTCRHCRNQFHEGDCPHDTAQQAILALAAREGWRRCNRCSAIVELTVGCYHMTCKCQYQFCYLCGERWKTCDCPQADEDRLMARAAEIANRNRGQGAGPVNAEMLRTIEERIMENHECTHSRHFRKVHGGYRTRFTCELCGERHRKYILECRRCDLQVCQECRNHRI